jgi:hypothetical protein
MIPAASADWGAGSQADIGFDSRLSTQSNGGTMSDDFDGVTPDMIRAAEKRAAAVAADRGEVAREAEPVVEVDAPVKARRQTTR